MRLQYLSGRKEKVRMDAVLLSRDVYRGPVLLFFFDDDDDFFLVF